MLFNFVHSKDVLRTTIAARKQWLGVVSTSSVLFYIAFQLYFSFRNKQPIRKTDLLENESAQGGHESGLKPLLLPARTTHTRLFPKKHSFSYSYLLVGIPVGWRGAVGSFLSADILPECIPGNFKSRKSWFNISAADYLDRGSEDSSLQGKLQSYLKSQVGQSSLTVRFTLKLND